VGRRVDVDDLLNAAEVAEIIGLSHSNSVTTYLRRYADFPRPIVEKSDGKIRLWLLSDIITWRQDRSR